MSSLVFYNSPYSTAGITEGVLKALKIPYETKNLDLKAGDTRTDAFKAINPNAKVPAIVHNGEAIWESAAITLYLGETFGVEKGLFPAPGIQRGHAFKWVVWSNVVLAAAASKYMQNMSPQGSDGTASAAGDKARTELIDALKILDGGVQGKKFLVEEKYTIVDTHILGIVYWITMLNIDLTIVPNVAAWKVNCDKHFKGNEPNSGNSNNSDNSSA